MKQIEEIATIKYLEHLKLLGFEYYNPKEIKKDEFGDDLPNSLDELKKVVENCSLCQLSLRRKNVVFGEGDVKSNIMFVGEGPGAFEDETGRPFVGKAGELLTKIITSVLEVDRSKVYIANIVKCRPPNNRVPTPHEAECCKPFLFKQIEIVNPKLIVALGATSYRYLTNDDKSPISRVRGEIIDFGSIKLIPTFHPSFLLRNPSAKREVYHDMLKVKRFL